jgi:hypothetical protein
MADSYKDIIITPNRSNTADPKIDLRGGNSSVNTAITVTVYPDSNGTLSFDGSAGQLFSITNDLSGLLWSVNDVSGIPSAEIYANGSVRFAEFSGNVSIGTATNSSKLFVNGNTTVNASINVTSTAALGNTTITGFANVSTTATIGTGFTLTSGNANFDSGVLFVDGTNNRVGVGNTTPGHVLSVTGTTNLGGAVTGITTLAAGNTTITGFANVSSTLAAGNTSITGFINATGDITAFFSDDRLKDRYSNIPNAVEKVKSLNGFYYEPNITAQDLGYQKEMHVGVSAQEVNAIMPEVVAPAPIDNKYLTVKYDRLIPLLIEAIKEQQIQIDELKAQLKKD